MLRIGLQLKLYLSLQLEFLISNTENISYLDAKLFPRPNKNPKLTRVLPVGLVSLPFGFGQLTPNRGLQNNEAD